jgi:glutaredoxin 2
MIFKICSPKNLAKLLAFFAQTAAMYSLQKKIDHNISFAENFGEIIGVFAQTAAMYSLQKNLIITLVSPKNALFESNITTLSFLRI